MTLFGSCAFSSSVFKFYCVQIIPAKMGRFRVNGRPICKIFCRLQIVPICVKAVLVFKIQIVSGGKDTYVPAK